MAHFGREKKIRQKLAGIMMGIPRPAAKAPVVKIPAAKACSTGLQPSKNSNITLEEMMAYLGFFIPSGGWALTILTPK